MNTKLADIRLLVIQEILGTLKDDGMDILADQLSQKIEVREVREDLWRVLDVETVQYIKQGNKTAADKIINRIHNKKRKRIIYVSATTLIIALLLASNVYKTKVPSKDVQLQLANGQVINLSNNNKVATVMKTYKAEYATLKIPAGKDYTMNLSDGTEVQLNAATTMRFPLAFTGNKREVFINGEAYLKVSPKEKPFIVHLPNSTVLVLGTEFNVNTYDVEKVALVKGAVKVNGLLLKPGQELIGSVINTFDEAEVLSWRQGKFVFSNTKLEDVCRIIPRIYGIGVELDNKEIGYKRFSGVIDKNKPIENVLKALKATNGIDYYSDEDNGTFHIR
jgi:hypothetical protein